MNARRCFAAAAPVIVLAFSPVLHAEGALFAPADTFTSNRTAAAALFREGAGLFARGEFAAAARTFEASHRIVPRAAPIYDAALAWDAAGNAARAADDYETALARTDLHGKEAEKARLRLRELDATLGTLDVSAPAGARVSLAELTSASPPVHVHLAAGRHRVVVQFATGEEQVSFVDVAVGARLSLTAEPRLALPVSPAGPSRPLPDVDQRRPLGWALLVAGATFGGTAAALGFVTLSNLEAFRQSNQENTSLRDRAITFRTLTNVAWALAGASAVAGGILLWTAPSRAAAWGTPSLVVGATGLSLRGSL